MFSNIIRPQFKRPAMSAIQILFVMTKDSCLCKYSVILIIFCQSA